MKDINEPLVSSEFETERDKKLSYTDTENRVMEDSESLLTLNNESDGIQKKIDDEKLRVEEAKRKEEAQKILFNKD